MSRKKTEISFLTEFHKNINQLVIDNGGDKRAFAEKIGVAYDTVLAWCNGENLPNGKQLIGIHEKFHCSLDWLLTGKTPEVGDVKTGSKEIQNAYKQLIAIMESDHPVIKPALLSNLAAFEYSITQEQYQRKDIETLKTKVGLLERALDDPGERTGTD